MQQHSRVQVRQHLGNRKTMEDRFSVREKKGVGIFLGVYDGHGGSDVADVLVHTVSAEFFYALDQTGDYETSMKMAYRAAERETWEYDCGSTAATAFINCKTMVYANAGDCAVFLAGSESTYRLTPSHRIDHPTERARVTSAGASVQDPYYLHKGMGLMPTRAFGDRTMREVGLHAMPDIGSYILSPHDRYVILTTDGVCDAVDIPEMDHLLRSCDDPNKAAQRIIEQANSKGSSDNMTVLIVPVEISKSR